MARDLQKQLHATATIRGEYFTLLHFRLAKLRLPVAGSPSHDKHFLHPSRHLTTSSFTMRVSFLALLLVSLGSCLGTSLSTLDSRQEVNGTLAPLEGFNSEAAIPGEYIVHLRKGHTLEEHLKTIGKNFSDQERFRRHDFLPGYTAQVDDDTLHNQIRKDPAVLLVEKNRRVKLISPINRASESSTPPGAHKMKRYTQLTQSGVTYGLQMVGAKGKLSLPAPPTSDHGDYDFVEWAGAGVQIYVMDTGIRTRHTLFGIRAVNFQGLQSTDKSPYVDEVMQDLEGHGTHVAGTIGADYYGVAPASTLINVKVLNANGSGNIDKIADAISDIVDEHNHNKKTYPSGFQFRGSVINMSLGWYGYSSSINAALKKAYYAGIPVIVASGNEYNKFKDPEPCSYIWTVCVGMFSSH